jgi:exosome complex RNA-binding protein Rrp4
MVDVPSDTWWLDIGANINVTNSLQKLQSTRKLSNGELKLNMGNSVKVEVE